MKIETMVAPLTGILYFVLFAVTVVVGLMASGCGSRFQGGTDAPCSGNNCASAATNSNSSTGGHNNNDPGQGGHSSLTWQSLKLEGQISSGSYAQAPVISLDKEKRILKIKLPMIPNPYLLLMGQIAIPQIPGAIFTMESLPNGTPAMVLNIPLEKLIKGIDFPAVDSLPTGDKLIDLGVPGGELPSFAVSLMPLPKKKDIRATLYMGPEVVAIFVNTPFDPTIRTPAIPINDPETAQTYGYFAVIPATATADGGFFISAQLPSEVARIIDELF